MGNQAIAADPLSKIWNVFASVKLTIVLLFSLAATSIIGTPENRLADLHFAVSAFR